MATTVDTLLVKIQSDMSDFKRDLDKIQKDTAKSTKGITKSFNVMAMAIKGTIAVVIASQVARMANSMVQLAGSVAEQTDKAKVVFGQNFGAVREELEAFGDEVGRATHNLVAMASSVQDTFVPLGFARSEASKLSVQLTKLAVDTGSFNDVQAPEVMKAFQSALVGNHETVRRFGIIIDQARIEQELFNMGIMDGVKSATAQQKVTARLNIITAGLGDAIGNAKDTADSFANSQYALNEALQEFQVEVITPLLPVLASFLRALTDIVNLLKNPFGGEVPLEGLPKVIAETVEEIAKLEGIIEQLKTGGLDPQGKKITELEDILAEFTRELDNLRNSKEKNIELDNKQIDLNNSLLKSFDDLRKGSRFGGIGFGQGRPDFVPKPSTDPSALKEFKKNLDSIRDARIRGMASQGEAFVALMEEAEFDEEFSKQRKTNQEEFFSNTKKFTDGSIKLSQARVKALQEEFERTKAVTEQLRDTSIRAFDRIADATADLLDGTTNDFDGIRSAMSMFLKDLQRTILQMTVFNKIKNQIFGTNLPTSSGGDIFDNIIGLFAGGGSGSSVPMIDAFAGGGKVQRGRPYMVGERGAELFVPNTGGTIMNNMNTKGMGGGSTVVNQTINVDAGVSQTVRAEIINLLPVIKQDTISSLLEAKRRGGSFATALS